MPSSEYGRRERAASIGSSSTAAGTADEHEKLATSPGRDKSMELGDVEARNEREDAAFLSSHADEKPEPPKSGFTMALVWMVINTLATIGIVSLDQSRAPAVAERFPIGRPDVE